MYLTLVWSTCMKKGAQSFTKNLSSKAIRKVIPWDESEPKEISKYTEFEIPRK